MLGLIGALIGGIGSAAGSVASAVGGLAAGAAGLGVSAVSGVVGGIGSLLFGAPAAGMTEAELFAAQAVPSYYETAGVLGGLPAAASSTVGYLGDLMPAAGGIYQMIRPPAPALAPSPAPAPAPAPAPVPSAKAPVPTLAQQPPVIMTVGAAAKPAAPNYLLYIGLAVLALFLLRKK